MKGIRKLLTAICSAVIAISGGQGIISAAAAQTSAAPNSVVAKANETKESQKPDYDKYSNGVYYKEGTPVAVEASYLDMNRDSKFSIADCVLLARFCTEDVKAVIHSKPDLNGDNNTDSDDLTDMLKLLYNVRPRIQLIIDIEVEPALTSVTTTATTVVTTTTGKPTTTKITTTTTTKATTTTTKCTTTTTKATTTTTKATTTKVTTTTAKPTTTKVTTTTAKPTTTKVTTTTAKPTTTKVTTTTAKPTTTKVTTTTAKPTTTKVTMTTVKPTTTKVTTTTAKPTTTKVTTTTAKPTTTKATTTTAKPTTTKATTTTTTTTTTKATTTTSKATTTTTTTTKATTTTTTVTTTSTTTTKVTTTTTTETTVTTTSPDIPEWRSVTDPSGAIINRNEYNTLCEYALSNDIRKFDIVWTGHKPIYNSIIVVGNNTADYIMADGAFSVTSGEEFYNDYKELFEADEEFTFDDVRDVKLSKYILWRVVDDEYIDQYPDHLLWWFEVEGEVQDIFFIIWPDIEGFPEWALIPK